MNIEYTRTIIDEGHFTEADYPFTIKPKFSKLGSIIEFSRQGPLMNYPPNVCIRYLLGFNATTLFEEYNLSPNLVDILSFDNIFFETDIVQWMIFRGKRSGVLHNFTKDVDTDLKIHLKI